MRDIFRVRSDAAEDAEDALHEEGRLDDAAIGKMRERIEMADVIALDLETRAVLGASRENVLDILEGVLEDALARAFEIGPLPVMFEGFEALEHRIEPEIHRAHIERSDFGL